jgi:hypothetical protein
MNLLGTGIVYAGLLVLLLGGVSVLKPLSFLRIRTRARGSLVLAAGLLIAMLGALLPASEARVATPRMHLDAFMPVYQFHEVHRMVVRAPRERVYRAIKEVTAGEIYLFRTLTWLRRFGQSAPEGILNAPERVPLLELATRTSFLLLAEEENREMVLGTIVVAPAGWRPSQRPTPKGFRALDKPGFAKAAMNFRLDETTDSTCVVTTETRVLATDAFTRRAFAAYWRVIYPGSSLIRQMWLRAVERRSMGSRRSNSHAVAPTACCSDPISQSQPRSRFEPDRVGDASTGGAPERRQTSVHSRSGSGSRMFQSLQPTRRHRPRWRDQWPGSGGAGDQASGTGRHPAPWLACDSLHSESGVKDGG